MSTVPAFSSNESSHPSDAPYLAQLNPPQREAVESTEGAVLVLAGAGTGKTRVLTTRIAHILNLGLARPSDILAVTFTNKAAHEMKIRVAQTLGRSIDGMWLGTFHALCVRILRTHAETLGFSEQFTILDMDDSLRLVKQLLQAEHVDEKEKPAKMVLNLISRWKDKALEPSAVPEHERGVVWKIYNQYQERLKILNAMDFGDLLLHCLKLFREFPNVLKNYQSKFRYLLVDEYQDTNIAQYLWLRLLAMESANICCVGDDDQSIYGWRGAEIGNILRFDEDFPGAKTIRLEQNYRSTSYILQAASGLIAHNRDRLGKTLWTDQDGGEKVLIRGTYDSDAEARFVGEEIESLQRQSVPLGQIAVLVRASFQTREFEERFLKLGLPYRVIGGQKFYERQEVRDAIAYIRLLVQPDDGLAFERIINVPRRGIGQATIQNLHVMAREQGVSLPRVAYMYADSPGKGTAKANIKQFFDDLYRWRQLLTTEPHVEVVKRVLDESGYTAMWMNDKSPDAPGRLENLKELVIAITDFEYLPGFLEHISLVMDNAKTESAEQITVMTLHAAKGLEYNHVFLPGWEETIFPHQRALDDSGTAGLEEERRLGYVGISRARVKATICYSLYRKMYKGYQPAVASRFIKELPTEAIVHIQANGNEFQKKDHDFGSYAGKRNNLLKSPVWQQKEAFPTIQQQPMRHSYKIADRVFHQKFGYGSIVNIEGDYLEIDFDHTGLKKVVYNFVSS